MRSKALRNFSVLARCHSSKEENLNRKEKRDPPAGRKGWQLGRGRQVRLKGGGGVFVAAEGDGCSLF